MCVFVFGGSFPNNTLCYYVLDHTIFFATRPFYENVFVRGISTMTSVPCLSYFYTSCDCGSVRLLVCVLLCVSELARVSSFCFIYELCFIYIYMKIILSLFHFLKFTLQRRMFLVLYACLPRFTPCLLAFIISHLFLLPLKSIIIMK